MTTLILSSVAAGVLGTAPMLAVTYLPALWRGSPCDVTGMLGSALTGTENARSRYLGTGLFLAGGVAFAFLYGLVVATFMRAGSQFPSLPLPVDLAATLDLAYLLVGLAMGVVHGGFVVLLATILITEHHPLERYRGGWSFVAPLLAGHLAFGATVAVFQHQFLQLLAG